MTPSETKLAHDAVVAAATVEGRRVQASRLGSHRVAASAVVGDEFVGDRSWGQVRGLRGDSGLLKEGVRRDGKKGVDGSSPSEGLKYLHTGTSCCLFRHDAGELYGGGERGGDLQALRIFPAPIDGREGTLREHAATVGSYVSCSSS
jgi:hypothetical protein